MTMLLLVAVGSAVGSAVRWLVTRYVQARSGSGFAWGTLVVNVVGSFALGVLLAAASAGRVSAEVVALLGAGVCGGLTTFSTFGYETVRSGQGGPAGRRRAVLNVTASVGVGLAAVVVGLAVFR